MDDDDDDVNNDVGFVCNAEDAKNVVWKELKFCRHRHKRERTRKKPGLISFDALFILETLKL